MHVYKNAKYFCFLKNGKAFVIVKMAKIFFFSKNGSAFVILKFGEPFVFQRNGKAFVILKNGKAFVSQKNGKACALPRDTRGKSLWQMVLPRDTTRVVARTCYSCNECSCVASATITTT